MIKSDWIVGARLNYERGTPFPRYIASFSAATRRTWPRARSRAAARGFNTCERSFISSVTNER